MCLPMVTSVSAQAVDLGIRVPAVPGHHGACQAMEPGSPVSLQLMGSSHLCFLSLKGETVSQV